MKNLNKVLAMLVVFMMVLSTVAFASSFSDVADTSSYSKAIEVGVDLGLVKGYEDGTFAPEGEITRAEFAAIIVRLLGQEAQAEGAKAATQFADVPAEHWAAGYINIAVQAAVINGYGNGNFGPEDLVEYQDAITMMVRALGYEPAIGSAGYPTGYLTKAGELGLTTGVNGSNGVAANRGAVAQIAFNALDVPIMTQSGYGTFTQYVINDGYSATTGDKNVKKTLLSENHSTIKLQGTVLESSDSTSTSTTAAPSVQFSITDGYKNKFGIYPSKDANEDGTLDAITRKVYVGETDIMDFVGKKVIIFAEYDEFEDRLTAKAFYEVAVDTLVIDIVDIVGITDDGIEYYINDTKKKTATIDWATSSVFYNGVDASVRTGNPDIIPDGWGDMSGTVELSLLNDATTNGDFDTLYITAYDIFVVDEVIPTSKRVTSKIPSISDFRGRISWNDENGDVKATLADANGNAMEWTDLAEYDVLMVKYVDAGAKELFEAKVIENTITGTVTGLSGTEETDERYVEIDGTEYKVGINAELEKVMKLGDEGTYYLDDNDNVVYHNALISRNNNYAYVIAAQSATDMDNAKVKVLSKENGIVTVEVANKVTVSYKGDKATNVSVKNFAYDLSQKANANNHFGELADVAIADLEGVIVTYKLNAAGQVSAIEIPALGEQDEDYLCLNDAGTLEGYDEDAASFKFGGKKHYITEDTVIFYVPYIEDLDGEGNPKLDDNGDVIYIVDEDNAEVVALTNLSDDQDLFGAVVYDTNDDKYIGAIALEAENQITPTSNNATFVTKVSATTDEDGYDVYRISGFKGLEEVSYICEDDWTGLEGSLVLPVYKANGDVNYFNVIGPDFDDVRPDDEIEAAYDLDLTEYYDAAEEEVVSPIDSRRKNLLLNDGADEFKVDASANVYVYDSTASTRNKHRVGEGLAYVEYDVIYDDNDEYVRTDLYIDGEKANDKNVAVFLYIYDGDVVDVVYYIY